VDSTSRQEANTLCTPTDHNENPVTSICSGTSLLAHADSALRALRGEQPTPGDLLDGETHYKRFGPLRTGTVCRRVTKADDGASGLGGYDAGAR
jgi:hypothetical protein